MTSYQANFASHHTRDRHVGFLLALHGIGKHNKMSRYFLLSSYHISKLYRYGKNIRTHTGNFISFCEVNQKFMRFFFFFSLCCTIQKENLAAEQNCVRIVAYRIMQTLYCAPLSRTAQLQSPRDLSFNPETRMKAVYICLYMSFIWHLYEQWIYIWMPYIIGSTFCFVIYAWCFFQATSGGILESIKQLAKAKQMVCTV